MDIVFDVSLLIFGLGGFFWGGLTAPLSIRLAEWYGIMDMPNARKIHTSRMPRGAGLGIWAGYMLFALCMTGSFPWIKLAAAGASIIFFCGYLDDMCSLSPFLRLGLHFLASSIVVLPLGLPAFTSLIAIVWVAGVTSAYNLIDGVNGLCISIFIASSAALAFMGASAAGVCMGAMALGVLWWNFPRAQTFLGDGGSTLMGYLFASHFLCAARGTLMTVGFNELILLMLLFGGVPVLDTTAAFSRRIMMGKSPFYPDKGHLHHILMALTGSAFWSVIILLSLQVLLLSFGLVVYARLS